ncbi:MAG: tryptophanase, partial [Rickettsiales bacterium]|nr:tryptophanase [Rickettsiales bacterium]
NTFLLKNKDVFLDMLTDSGVNAMSDLQQTALLRADDTYAGSESFFRLNETTKEIFGKKFLCPAHQGRACENILSRVLVKQGQTVIMNFHFTTSKAHVLANGGTVEELLIDEGLKAESDFPFKGNMDLNKLEKSIKNHGAENIAFVRMEAGTNLIGGQPFSLKNLKDVSEICRKNEIKLVLDASLLTDNLFFIKTREESCKNMTISEITRAMSDCSDIIYFSARKLGSARGGVIVLNDEELLKRMQELCTLFEGFITYGGMSLMEVEAINVGLQEAMDFEMINQGPEFIKFLIDELVKNKVPVVLPSGGLGAHLDAKRFVSHIPQSQYQAASLTAAIFIVSGIRGMERGTMAESRNSDGSEHFAAMELVRLAAPRRVFSMSHMKFVADRISWLFKNRNLIGGLKFVEEPKTLRFFLGKMAPVNDWQDKLVSKFKEDFGDSL